MLESPVLNCNRVATPNEVTAIAMVLESRHTLGPAYNEFGYNEHSAITNRFLCTILIDSNAKKSNDNEHQPTTIFLLVESGTQCTTKSRIGGNYLTILKWNLFAFNNIPKLVFSLGDKNGHPFTANTYFP